MVYIEAIAIIHNDNISYQSYLVKCYFNIFTLYLASVILNILTYQYNTIQNTDLTILCCLNYSIVIYSSTINIINIIITILKNAI